MHVDFDDFLNWLRAELIDFIIHFGTRILKGSRVRPYN